MGIVNEIMQSVIEEVNAKTSDENQQKEIIEKVFSDSLPQIVDDLICSLNESTHYMLTEHRYIDLEFNARLNRRWFEAFDLLEKCIVASLEIGEEIQKNGSAFVNNDNKELFEVLLRLHARGIQISKEILVLLRNGYADGAFARWRTLYELSIVSLFISKHGNKIAKQYIDYATVETYGELKVYQEKNIKLKFGEIPEEEKNRQEKIINELKTTYGNEYLRRYGWTYNILEKNKRTFEGIEENVESDHLRPFYKWACNTIHAGPKAAYYSIGVCGPSNLMLAGPTNFGFADPGQNTALAIFHLTSSLVLNFMDYDNIVELNVLSKFLEETKKKFFEIQSQLKKEQLLE